MKCLTFTCSSIHNLINCIQRKRCPEWILKKNAIVLPTVSGFLKVKCIWGEIDQFETMHESFENKISANIFYLLN